jgi:hypothetical protein
MTALGPPRVDPIHDTLRLPPSGGRVSALQSLPGGAPAPRAERHDQRHDVRHDHGHDLRRPRLRPRYRGSSGCPLASLGATPPALAQVPPNGPTCPTARKTPARERRESAALTGSPTRPTGSPLRSPDRGCRTGPQRAITRPEAAVSALARSGTRPNPRAPGAGWGMEATARAASPAPRIRGKQAPSLPASNNAWTAASPRTEPAQGTAVRGLGGRRGGPASPLADHRVCAGAHPTTRTMLRQSNVTLKRKSW